MAEVWFDADDRGDADVAAFLATMNEAALERPPPVDPDDVWTAHWEGLVYIAVPAQPPGAQWSADLEVGFSPGDRRLIARWGDGRYLLDGPADLTIERPEMPASEYARRAFDWLHKQFARRLERHGWSGRPGYRVVLADSGEIVAHHGPQPWLRSPNTRTPLVR